MIRDRTHQLLLLDELDVTERFGRKLDGLIKPILTPIGDIDNLDDFALETVIKLSVISVSNRLSGQ